MSKKKCLSRFANFAAFIDPPQCARNCPLSSCFLALSPAPTPHLHRGPAALLVGEDREGLHGRRLLLFVVVVVIAFRFLVSAAFLCLLFFFFFFLLLLLLALVSCSSLQRGARGHKGRGVGRERGLGRRFAPVLFFFDDFRRSHRMVDEGPRQRKNVSSEHVGKAAKIRTSAHPASPFFLENH